MVATRIPSARVQDVPDNAPPILWEKKPKKSIFARGSYLYVDDNPVRVVMRLGIMYPWVPVVAACLASLGGIWVKIDRFTIRITYVKDPPTHTHTVTHATPR